MKSQKELTLSLIAILNAHGTAKATDGSIVFVPRDAGPWFSVSTLWTSPSLNDPPYIPELALCNRVMDMRVARDQINWITQHGWRNQHSPDELPPVHMVLVSNGTCGRQRAREFAVNSDVTLIEAISDKDNLLARLREEGVVRADQLLPPWDQCAQSVRDLALRLYRNEVIPPPPTRPKVDPDVAGLLGFGLITLQFHPEERMLLTKKGKSWVREEYVNVHGRRCGMPGCEALLKRMPDGYLDPEQLPSWYRSSFGFMLWACPEHRDVYEAYDAQDRAWEKAWEKTYDTAIRDGKLGPDDDGALRTEEFDHEAFYDEYVAEHPRPAWPPVAEGGSLRKVP